MRAKAVLAFGLIAVLAGCSDPAVDVAAQWGCGRIDGLKQITGEKASAYVLVGEFTETNEAPAAFAEIACNLAAYQDEDDGPLFVGVSEYAGGATDAERNMRARLDQLAAKGAPIIVGTLRSEDHPYAVHQRSAGEAKWAKAIEAQVQAAGASRALLLLPRTDAIAEIIRPRGDRFAGYAPMATHLPEGEVAALEIGMAPTKGLEAPAVRFYPAMTGGFHGQVALATLTRPAVEPLIAEARVGPPPPRAIGISNDEMLILISPDMAEAQRIEVLKDYFVKQLPAATSGATSGEAKQVLRSKVEGIARDYAARSMKLIPVRSNPAPVEPSLSAPEPPPPQVDLPDFKAGN